MIVGVTSRSLRTVGPVPVLLVALAIVATFTVIAAGWRVAYVHAETTEWKLWPAPAPPRIGFDGRHYNRSALGPTSISGMQLAGELQLAGETSGGAPIYAGALTPGCLPTVIVVVDDGQAWQYGLSGGPC